jgi:AAA domain, putative AbiEii toxin, Type IV TA system
VLESFSVEGFRTFSRLRIDRLARVNLIVGKNNVGKTVLLEALRLYAARGDAATLRTSVLEPYGIDLAESDRGAFGLQMLFHRSRAGRDDTRAISLGPLDSPGQEVRIDVLLPGEPLPERVWEYLRGISEQYVSDAFVKGGLGKLRIISVGPNGGVSIGVRTDSNSLLSIGAKPIYYSSFVPARGVPSADVERWWDAIVLQPPEEDVIRCLRLVEPVERVSLVEHPVRRSERVVMVRLEGENRPVPLRTFGDGMDRIFQIALSLTQSRVFRTGSDPEGGWPQSLEADFPGEPLLLLDEIENGIHYSVLPKLWEFLMRIASSQNVQIFATTHSWDCIEAFQAAAAAVPDVSCQLLRLERYGQEIEPVIFDRDELPVVTRDEIEVR